jgi:thiosulfate/3-mercaptopyruvate sulfurtransferase
MEMIGHPSRAGMRMTICLVGILAGCGRESTPSPFRMPASRSMLLHGPELQQILGDEALRILDVRPEEDFLRGHVPGAVCVDVNAWEAQSLQTGGLDDTAYWASAVGGLGIDTTTRVAVYGDRGDLPSAARVWWLLKFQGLQHVSLLDGGWQAWQEAGYPITTGASQIAPRRFQARKQVVSLIGLDALRQGLDSSSLQLVDARERQEYTGEKVLGTRAGHVATAVNLPWTELLDAEGRFKEPAELQRLLRAKGITDGKPLAVYCYSGARSSVVIFGLQLAGLPDAKNYYRGWWEWSAAPDAPVSTGPKGN